MLPWGHAAVGYLLYAAYVRYRNGDHGEHRVGPAGLPVLALAVGTQFPDVVDKPLGWYLGALPGGRSLAHSLLVAAVVLGAVHWAATRHDAPELGVGFAVGHLSHLAADALYPVLAREWVDVAYLLWPLVADPDPVTDARITEVLLASSFSLTGYVEVGLFAVATALWMSDGMPGLAELNAGAATAARRLSPR